MRVRKGEGAGYRGVKVELEMNGGAEVDTERGGSKSAMQGMGVGRKGALQASARTSIKQKMAAVGSEAAKQQCWAALVENETGDPANKAEAS